MNTENFPLGQAAADLRHWLLDPEMTFLGHGGFGACPRAVLEKQTEWRARMERQPLHFQVRELERHLDHAREVVALFVGATPEDLVFVPNATAGVNTILRSLTFHPGDELLVTNQEYNASRNALNFAAERAGARVVVVNLPFPVKSADEIIAAVLEKVTARTKLALLDHVTSQTAVVLPIATLVAQLRERGVETLVDGAHAPGMAPLNLDEIGAAYYTGNAHKWLCAPKGAALLHVRRDKQEAIRPLAISHGANSSRKDRSRFLIEFAWQGTSDPTACLCIPESIHFMASLLPGGWPEIMARNRALALAASKTLCASLGIPAPCPEELIGSIGAIPLPDAPAHALPVLPYNEYPLQDVLREKYKIAVPIIPWPAPPKRVLRFSAQLYNSLPQYELLAKALAAELKAE